MNPSPDRLLRCIAQFLFVLLPLSIVFGKAGIDILGTLIALLFLADVAWRRQWQVFNHSWVKWGLAFWGFQMLSAAWAYDPLLALKTGFIWGRFLLFGVALAYWLFEDETLDRKFLDVTAAAFLFLCLDAIYQYYSGVDWFGHEKLGGRLTGPFGMPQVGTMIMYLLFPLLAFVTGSAITTRRRIVYLAVSLLALLTMVMSGDRSPLLLTLLGGGLFFKLLIHGRKSKYFLLFLGAFGVLVALQMFVFERYNHDNNNYVFERQVVSTATTISNFEGSSYGLLLKDTMDMLKEHPLLGTGAGNIRVYWCTMGKYRYFAEGCPLHPHNIYMDMLGSLGPVGLALFLMMIGCIAKQFYQDFSRWRHDPLTAGIAITLFLRLWPIIFVTAHTRAISAFTLWLMIGWGISRLRRFPQ